MCVRYTYFDLAEPVYAQLSTAIANSMFNMSTSDLSLKGWLDFMHQVCQAECARTRASQRARNVSELIRCLNEALALLIRAQTLFKATCTRSLQNACFSSSANNSSNNTHSLENATACFQIRFCELRSEQVKTYIHLVLSVMTCETIPAPAFQLKAAENFNRLGRIAQQMKYGVNELQKLNQKYRDLLFECFDADQHTINILNM